MSQAEYLPPRIHSHLLCNPVKSHTGMGIGTETNLYCPRDRRSISASGEHHIERHLEQPILTNTFSSVQLAGTRSRM